VAGAAGSRASARQPGHSRHRGHEAWAPVPSVSVIPVTRCPRLVRHLVLDPAASHATRPSLRATSCRRSARV